MPNDSRTLSSTMDLRPSSRAVMLCCGGSRRVESIRCWDVQQHCGAPGSEPMGLEPHVHWLAGSINKVPTR